MSSFLLEGGCCSNNDSSALQSCVEECSWEYIELLCCFCFGTSLLPLAIIQFDFFMQSWSELLAPLVNMNKESCDFFFF